MQVQNSANIDQLVNSIIALAPPAIVLKGISRELSTQNMVKYQLDPVAWCRDILGESFPPEVEELMRSVVTNEVTVAQSCNAYGKSFAASRMAPWWLLCFPNSQVYITAAPPESNIRKIVWAHIASIVDKNSRLFAGYKITDLHIERDRLNYITAITIPVSGTEAVQEAKASGKHAENLLWIGDEADGIPEPVFRGIEACSSGGLARQLYMFNPRAEQGTIYRMIREGRCNVVKLNAFSHPNVVTGGNVFPGAVDRMKTCRRINQWSRPLAQGEKSGADCFELPSFLEGFVAVDQANRPYPSLRPGWYKITEAAFSYMVLGEYPAQGSNQLISRQWIASARSRWDSYVLAHGEKPPQYSTCVIGLDVADMGEDLNTLCARWGGFVERIPFWSGIDLAGTGDRGAVEAKDRKAVRVNIDGTGVGAGVASHMQRDGVAASSVKVASKPTEKSELGEFGILRDQLWWATREWLRTDPGSMLPPDEILLEELLVPTYRVDNGKVRIMKKDYMREILKHSPDRAESLILTFYNEGFFSECDLT